MEKLSKLIRLTKILKRKVKNSLILILVSSLTIKKYENMIVITVVLRENTEVINQKEKKVNLKK
jgi:hypothetical protein